MSYDIHILRRPGPDNSEHKINAAEWIAYVESDSGLERVISHNTGLIQAKLTSAPIDEDDGQVLTWAGGGISASYPQKPLLAKMSQIAKHFGAEIVSDDGDIWIVSEEGSVRVDSQVGASEVKHPPDEEKRPLPRGIMWPYFKYDSETDPRRIILWLLSCQPDSDMALAERCLADGLQLPLHEAAAALRTCQSGQPVGMPLPEDLEEACSLCERLEMHGIVNKGCGVQGPPW